jgi:Holliday junction DNA helicase RuvA
MIGKLKGTVDSFDEDELILDVNGVGYLVAASRPTCARTRSSSTAS